MQDFHLHAWLAGDSSGREAAGASSATLDTPFRTELALHHLLTSLQTRQAGLRRPVEPEPVDLSGFTHHLTGPDGREALAFVERLLLQGRTMETVLLRVMAPAARWLGQEWEADRCDFIDVSIGLGRLQQILHVLGPTWDDPFMRHERPLQALFLPAPDETHRLGIAMVDAFFRADGWLTQRADADDYLEHLKRFAFDVVGFSLSCTRYLDSLSGAIEAARRHSLNSSIVVLVGGPVFLDEPGLVARVGADATACDGAEAVHTARSLLNLNVHV